MLAINTDVLVASNFEDLPVDLFGLGVRQGCQVFPLFRIELVELGRVVLASQILIGLANTGCDGSVELIGASPFSVFEVSDDSGVDDVDGGFDGCFVAR